MLMWGVLPVALKPLLEQLDAYTITWYRFLISAVVLFAALAFRGSLPQLGALSPSGWVLMVIAVVGLSINYAGYVVGLDLSTPANAQVLIQLAPILLALGGLAIFRERFTRLQWGGFAILLTGLGLFFAGKFRALAQLAGSADSAELSLYLKSVIALLIAAVTWAVYGLAQKQLLRSFPSQALMLCIYAGCGICLTPLAQPMAALDLDALGWSLLVFCALNTVLGYGALAASLQHLEASRISALLALVPLATFSSLWLASGLWPQSVAPENIAAIALAGALLVVCGSLVTAVGGENSA